MSEDAERDAQDTELRLEDLDKVAGGEISIDLLDKGEVGYWYVARCPYCSFNIEFPATSSLEDSEEIVRRHIQLYHPTGETWDDPFYMEAP